MGFDSVYRLSVVLNMIDNLSSPMRGASENMTGAMRQLDSMSQTFGGMAQTGAVMTGLGVEIAQGVLAPVQATFETKKALGELSSLGIEDLGALEDAATSFSDQWAGTTKSDFISAAYDIKSGIASLSDTGVGEYTKMAGLTATATKSTTAEMTNLFATGYGIYKDYYKDMSDVDFGEMFSAGISKSVQQFKTTGSGMAQAIQTLGSSATTSNVPLEEQLSIMGMLQATMSGSEAGTKYKAFLRTAAKGGEALGLSFTDANNQLLSMPEILGLLNEKFGDTLDSAEKMDLQKAFGDTESIALIENLYSKTGNLQDNILGLYVSMGQGTVATQKMADAINNTEPAKFETLKQQLHNVSEDIGNTLLPTITEYMGKAGELIKKADEWIANHQELVSVIMKAAIILSGFLIIGGAAITVIGGIGLIFTKTASLGLGFVSLIRGIPGMFETMRIKAMYAGDAIMGAFTRIKAAGATAVTGIKNVVISIASFAKTAVINGVQAAKTFVLSIASMAKQAVMTAVTAMPGLIASVWAFTVALLANPITWIVIGIVALIAALILLWQNWDTVVAFVKGIFTGFVDAIVSGFNWIKEKVAALPGVFKVLIAVMFPFISIPILIVKNWDKIVAFFGGLFTKVLGKVKAGIQSIKNFLNGVPAWFRESGKKIITTFTAGITSVITKPAEAIKKGLQKIRNLLPFSDAKEGPLSTLTLSGNRVLQTVSTGIEQSENLPAKAVEKSFEKVNLTTKQSVNRIALDNGSTEQAAEKRANGSEKEKGKTFIIQKLIISPDMNKLKDINKLFTLIGELEDKINSNAEEEKGEADPVLA